MTLRNLVLKVYLTYQHPCNVPSVAQRRRRYLLEACAAGAGEPARRGLVRCSNEDGGCWVYLLKSLYERDRSK